MAYSRSVLSINWNRPAHLLCSICHRAVNFYRKLQRSIKSWTVLSALWRSAEGCVHEEIDTKLRWIQKEFYMVKRSGKTVTCFFHSNSCRLIWRKLSKIKTSSQPVIGRKTAVNDLEFDTRCFGTSLSTIQLNKWYTSRFLLNCTLERSVSILWAIKMNQHPSEAVGRHFAKQYNLLRHQFTGNDPPLT